MVWISRNAPERTLAGNAEAARRGRSYRSLRPRSACLSAASRCEVRDRSSAADSGLLRWRQGAF